MQVPVLLLTPPHPPDMMSYSVSFLSSHSCFVLTFTVTSCLIHFEHWGCGECLSTTRGVDLEGRMDSIMDVVFDI
jgi:hypothetical protein